MRPHDCRAWYCASMMVSGRLTPTMQRNAIWLLRRSWRLPAEAHRLWKATQEASAMDTPASGLARGPPRSSVNRFGDTCGLRMLCRAQARLLDT